MIQPLMTTATASLEIYHALVRAGLKDDVADDLAKQIISRTEVQEVLPSKQDLHLIREELRDEMQTTSRWLINVFVGIALGQLAITITVMTLLLNFYLGTA